MKKQNLSVVNRSTDGVTSYSKTAQNLHSDTSPTLKESEKTLNVIAGIGN